MYAAFRGSRVEEFDSIKHLGIKGEGAKAYQKKSGHFKGMRGVDASENHDSNK